MSLETKNSQAGEKKNTNMYGVLFQITGNVKFVEKNLD